MGIKRILISDQKQIPALIKLKGRGLSCLILDDKIKLSEAQMTYFSDVKYLSDFNVANKRLEAINKAFDMFNEIANMEMEHNRKLCQLFSYKGNSLLHIMSVNFYGIEDDSVFSSAFAKYLLLKEIIKSEDALIIIDPITDWEKIAVIRAKELGITVEKISGKNKKFHRPSWFFVFYVLLKGFLRSISPSKKYMYDKQKERIAFIYPNHKYRDVIYPLIQKTLAKNKFQVFMLNLFERASFSENSVKEIDVLKGAGISVFFSCVISWFKLIFKWKRIVSTILSSRKGDFHGKILGAVMDPLQKNIFNIIGYLLVIEGVKKQIEKYGIRLLFNPIYVDAFGRSVTAGAKLAGAKIVAVKRGLEVDIPENYVVDDLVDKLIMRGDYGRELYIRRGALPEKLAVTGLPIYDDLIKKMQNACNIKREVCQGIGFDPGRFIFLYCTQPPHIGYSINMKRNETSAVFGAIKLISEEWLNNYCLIIKMHPNSNIPPSFYEEIASDKQIVDMRVLRSEVLLSDLIVASDFVFMKTSTVGQDVIIAKRPLLIIDFNDSARMYSFTESGRTQLAQNIAEVPLKLREMLISSNNCDTRKQEEFLYHHFNNLDGKAADRIYNILEDTLRRN